MNLSHVAPDHESPGTVGLLGTINEAKDFKMLVSAGTAEQL